MNRLMNSFRPKTYKSHYPRWMVGKPLLIASSALASLGDAMFGYSQGIIAGVQVQPSFIERMYGLKNVTEEMIAEGNLNIDPFVQAITVSCLNISAMIAALLAAYVCDILGRRSSVRIGAIIYLISALLQIFAPNLTTLIIGRIIQGLGVGFLSMTVPVIQAEIAPGHARGFFVSIEYLCLNGGYALSAWVGYGFYFLIPSEISWRGPYIVQAAISIVLIAWTWYLPETPRWLIKNGFKKEGLATIADLQGNGDPTDPKILAVYEEIIKAIAYESHLGGEASWSDLFTKYARRTVMGVTSQMFAQLNGINALLYFLPENLLRAGFDVPRSLLYSGGCALVYVAGTIPAMFLVDTWGRKPLLLIGSVALAVCLTSVGGLQLYEASLPLGDPKRLVPANGIFALVCLYLFFFGASWGPVPWLLPAEVFPIRARAKGMALATGSNWIWNFIIAFITPPLFNALSGGYYFLITGFVVISFFLVWLVYKETAHRTLEELSEVFGEKGMDDDVRIEEGVDDMLHSGRVTGATDSELTLAESSTSGGEKKDERNGGEKTADVEVRETAVEV